MSDEKKDALKRLKIKAAAAAKAALATADANAAGLPAGVRVQSNVQASQRFPLPLTIVSAVVTAIGVLAFLKGHRIIGGVAAAVGAVGIGAAAAAPELNAQLNKVGVQL